MDPMPKCSSVGIISRSSSRYIALCWFCIEMNGVSLFWIAYSALSTTREPTHAA